MEKEIITIPKVDYCKPEEEVDIYSSLLTISSECRKITEEDPLFKSLVEKYKKRANDNREVINSRKNRLRELFGKYYKMTRTRTSRNITYTYISYIFPYLITDTNDVLYLLEITDNDGLWGGIKDTSYEIGYYWDYDITLEEITEEEFRQKAIEDTKRVIDRRLRRLSEAEEE